MKKVGVITMHRVVNYGSFLQTYATQKVLESLGFDCEIIDYKYPNAWQYSHGFCLKSSRKNALKLFLNRFFSPILDMFNSSYGGMMKRSTLLRDAVKLYLHLSQKEYSTFESLQKHPPYYDIYITGSDQTWNVNHMRGDSNFLLSFVNNNSLKVAFSASMTTNDENLEFDEIFRKYLPLYSYISIREKGNIERVKNLSGKNDIAVTLDPTLLLSKSDWITFASKRTKIKVPLNGYVVLYMLNYSFDPQPYIYKLLKHLQLETGLTVLTFSKIPKEWSIDSQYVGRSSVEDFIEIFSKASYVVTSSYHGTVFALNFGVPLYSIVPQNFRCKDSRQIDILETFGAKECIVPIGLDLSRISLSLPKQFYKNISERLEDLRASSLQWLSSTLYKN